MIERYGPWSSALGDGLSPHLSTFWKQRLARLAAAQATESLTTRRDWLKLGVAGAAACALPTLHLASADGFDDVKSSAAGKIYLPASMKTGPGKNDWLHGVFAVDPETATYNKVCDFYWYVRVSRDGRTLSMAEGNKKNRSLWTLDAEGQGEKRRIADFGPLTTSWSPDGKQIIVAKSSSEPEDPSYRCETWRINADGSDATKLPIPETDEVHDWSPDGRWLVTASDRHPPHGRGYQLYIMRPDGTDQRRLTQGQGLNVYPRFSPDSQRIAYMHMIDEHSPISLWVVNIDGSGRHRVLEEENNSITGEVCWSPDGKSLAYTLEDWQRDTNSHKFSGRNEKSKPRLVIINDDGKNRRTLDLPLISVCAPDWR